MGVLLLLLALAPLAAQGPKVPENDGWVTDRAGLLDAGQEAALEALMESYRQGSGHEVALLTVASLEGRPIEELGLAVGRAWKIGREGKNDGALLLVARDDREMRIEVGRGLEGNLTDSICGRIIRDVVAPRFKAGRFYDGLREGIEAIHAAAGGDYGKIPRRRGDGPGSLLGVFVLLFLVLPIVLGSRRRRGHGIEPFLWGAMMGSSWGGGRGGGHGGGFGGGGFGGFGGGGGFSGGGASGGW